LITSFSIEIKTDRAMANNGGIDLTPARMKLETKVDGMTMEGFRQRRTSLWLEVSS